MLTFTQLLNSYHLEPTQSVCVTDCFFYSKCTGFAVCLTHSDISLSMCINQCVIQVDLPYLWYIVVLLPLKRFFERFWRILSSPFTVSNNRNNNRRTQNPSKSFKIAQKTAFEAKGGQFTTGTVIQRLFNIDFYKITTRALIGREACLHQSM